MKRPKLFWQLLNSYLWVNILVLVVLAFVIALTFKHLFLEKYTNDLKSKTELLSVFVKDRIVANDYNSLDEEVKTLSQRTSTRVTVMLKDGTVVADSDINVNIMDNHANRPEFIDSLKNGVGVSKRFSKTLSQERLYVALSFLNDSSPKFILRTSVTIERVNAKLANIYRQIAIVFAFFIVLNTLVSLWLSKRFGAPLKIMVNKFRQVAKYDFSGDIELKKSDSEEMNAVAEAINNVSKELQQNQEEIFKLENMRKEFVANVSHELKTPITSIKGFVETLLDGAINNSNEATNFLEIILRQSNRLDSIINDLLSLSRFENEIATAEVHLDSNPVILAIQSAVDTCRSKASKTGIHIKIDCDDKIEAMIDVQLMEQALINLITNAIMYSGTNEPIVVSAYREDSKIVISVKDEGVGIPSKHQERIFERFYRVDKARSREQGGTGLGLSIVKHIAAMHNGEVQLASNLGEGSNFLIILDNERTS